MNVRVGDVVIWHGPKYCQMRHKESAHDFDVAIVIKVDKRGHWLMWENESFDRKKMLWPTFVGGSYMQDMLNICNAELIRREDEDKALKDTSLCRG